MSNPHPSFVLVGHPNKGKSSIVSTLAYDDAVAVSDMPGETKKTRGYPLKVGEQIIYEIYDTPGFEDPKRFLHHLKQKNASALERPKALKDFVEENRDNGDFEAEIELLTPIVNGGAVVYVVDGSLPYKEEYEAEMEILTWSGNPSIGLINKIGEGDHVSEWKIALNQHFKVVREFNPMQVTLKSKIDLLQTFSVMNEDLQSTVAKSIAILHQDYDNRVRKSAMAIVESVYKSLRHSVTSSIFKSVITQMDKRRYEKSYREDLIRFEDESRKSVQKIWGHSKLHSVMNGFEISQSDLFSQESVRYGLSKSNLVMVSAVAGASVAGAAGFAMSAPTSLFDFGLTTTLATTISSGLGAVGGYVSGSIGYDKFLNATIIGSLMNKKQIQIGHMKNVNFIFILSARAIQHATSVVRRSHAKRDEMTFRVSDSADAIFDDEEKKLLAKISLNFQKNRKIDESKKKYAALIEKKMESI